MPTSADVQDIKSTTTFLDMEELWGDESLWYVAYSFLTDKNELSASNGYDVITQGERGLREGGIAKLWITARIFAGIGKVNF